MSDNAKSINALPAICYRDPAESLDELRRINERAKRKAEQERINKGRRIRALVKKVMNKGGGNRGV
jgi:hypothetical protein